MGFLRRSLHPADTPPAGCSRHRPRPVPESPLPRPVGAALPPPAGRPVGGQVPTGTLALRPALTGGYKREPHLPVHWGHMGLQWSRSWQYSGTFIVVQPARRRPPAINLYDVSPRDRPRPLRFIKRDPRGLRLRVHNGLLWAPRRVPEASRRRLQAGRSLCSPPVGPSPTWWARLPGPGRCGA